MWYTYNVLLIILSADLNVTVEYVPPLPTSKKVHSAYYKQTRRVSLQIFWDPCTPQLRASYLLSSVTWLIQWASLVLSLLRRYTLNIVFLQAVWAHVNIQYPRRARQSSRSCQISRWSKLVHGSGQVPEFEVLSCRCIVWAAELVATTIDVVVYDRND